VTTFSQFGDRDSPFLKLFAVAGGIDLGRFRVRRSVSLSVCDDDFGDRGAASTAEPRQVR